MKSRALLVPRERAEEARRTLRDAGSLRTDLEVRREGLYVVFPLTPSSSPDARLGTIVEREFAEVRRPPGSYRDLVRGVPPEAMARLPRAFDVIGDVVLIHLPPEVVEWKEEVGRALLAFVPAARRVGWDQGVHGVERRRRIIPLAGSGGFSTLCRENGLAIEVDLERAYFSPRLASEHRRIAEAVRAGERVLDLCCGVGPFSLTIARDGRAREITAVDVNPDAIALLRANLVRLGLEGRVRSVVADLEAFLPTAVPADRVILNLPHEGIKYLTSVANRVGPGGKLHYYEIMERSKIPDRSVALVDRLGGASAWAAEPPRTVHPYAPTLDLVAWTLTRREAR